MATYTVKSGDTLKKIADTFGVSVDDLVANNDFTSSDALSAGKDIDVPTDSPTAGEHRKQTDLYPKASGGTREQLSKYEGAYDPAADPSVSAAKSYLEGLQSRGKPAFNGASYDEQIADIYDRIVNREDFSYDMNADALYQQYRDQYILGGQKAMMDTMGQAAGLTGGFGSTYAQGAGQQAYGEYLQGLTDIIPELEERAYKRYADEGDRMLTEYELAGDRRDNAYGQYRDELGDYYTELGLAQDAYDRAYSNSRADYYAGQDYWLNAAGIEQGRQDQTDAAIASEMAAAGDFSGYKALGFSDDQIARLQQLWIAQNPKLAKKLGLESGSSSSDRPPKVDDKTLAEKVLEDYDNGKGANPTLLFDIINDPSLDATAAERDEARKALNAAVGKNGGIPGVKKSNRQTK